jgi:hypothetical protein
LAGSLIGKTFGSDPKECRFDPCSASLKERDMSPEDFVKEFVKYADWFEREKESPNGSWAWEFVEWLAEKIAESSNG